MILRHLLRGCAKNYFLAITRDLSGKPDAFSATRGMPEQFEEKVVEDAKSPPQALKAPARFQGLSGPTEVGPFPKLRES